MMCKFPAFKGIFKVGAAIIGGSSQK